MKNVNTVKSIVTGLFAVTVTSAAWAGLDRTLTVSDPDPEGNVTITLGDGGDSNGQALIAAWAPADRGDDVNAWDEFRYVGKVKVLPTDTARTFALPENWRTRSGCVRFFLMERTCRFRLTSPTRRVPTYRMAGCISTHRSNRIRPLTLPSSSRRPTRRA